ncbi:MAG: hypothetical protein HQK76_09545 [Desulfobacterales bacterium]|nr:hypothetical protein [Desulfobacterales bacterium]
MRDKTRCLVLLSSWHYKEIYKDYHLTPLLVALTNGEKYHKNILITKEKPVNAQAVLKYRIASANNIENSRVQLTEMFKDDAVAVQSARILLVPKDIDAIISVGFGMCEAALTMESSLETFKKLYPQLYENIIVFAKGKNVLSLILAAPESFVKEAEPLVSAIENMPKMDSGDQIPLLGIDGWQKIDSLIFKELEE